MVGAKQDYEFSLVDPRTTLTGEHLLELIDSWSGVERWWRQRRSRSEILIGYISYEHGYQFMEAPGDSIIWQKKLDTKFDQAKLPPVLFGRFQRGVRRKTTAHVLNDVASKIAALKKLSLKRQISQAAYRRMFTTAQQHLHSGDMYQVNLAHRLEFDTHVPAETLFWQQFKRQPVPYAALIRLPHAAILSWSPELFLRLQHGVLETRPMKGTRPRGRTLISDRRLRAALHTSTKEKAELDMIIDVHRNDLQRTAATGSVQVVRQRELIPYATVWQAQARIHSRVQPGYSPLDVLRTCFPAGSITGAPKLRAMEIIHDLEPLPRHIYCGSIGYITAGGEMQMNVAIRTGVMLHNTLYYYVGGGITLDSTLPAEWQETLHKADFLTK